MELSLLLAAEYANVTKDDKLNVMGIFANVYAMKFPVVYPTMFLITQLSATPAEYGREFKLSIKLLDEDAAKQLVNVSVKARVPRGRLGQTVNLNQVLRLVNVRFERPGVYEFSVLVDQDVKGTLALPVHLHPKAQEKQEDDLDLPPPADDSDDSGGPTSDLPPPWNSVDL
jgi:hypothetical protein